MSVAHKIAEIIQKRAESVKPLIQAGERCGLVLSNLNALEYTMSSFVANKNMDEKGIIPCQECLDQLPRIRRKVTELQQEINKCNARFCRPTINIGFGGKKGTGKSYLLQKLSGLTSNEVPSAKGLPVTAVSSKIYNSHNSKAIVTFYDESSFLREIIAPYCEALEITQPTSLDALAQMEIPANDDLKNHYRERLQAFKEHLPEYRTYLSGGNEEINLNDIRKFVAYTDINGTETYSYLAVRDATIFTPFPKTDVKQLGFIDLPGLGELNPTVEKRHTSGFEDDVDLVMLIRRPSSERVDWDQADHNALLVLQRSTPVDNFSNFVVIVHNEGDCDDKMAQKSIQSMKSSLPDNFTILRTKGKDTEELSQDILEKILSHLALNLPEMDQQTLNKIFQESQTLWKKIADFAQDARVRLKASNDVGFKGEIYIQQGKDIRDEFSDGCMEALEQLETDIQDKREDERLLECLNHIQGNIDAYFENGLERKTSKEDWVKKSMRTIATKGNSAPVFLDTANNIRVKIAEEFTAMDHIYQLKVDELLDKIASLFDQILPGFLPEGNARDKMNYLKKRIENADDETAITTIYDAIDTLLNIKVEHRTQFYPRVYEPIRNFRGYVKNNPTITNANELDREQQAEAIYKVLKDLSDRTIMEMTDLLKVETARINDILYVSLEHFIDKIVRSENAENQWARLVSAFYSEIWGTNGNAAASIAISDIITQLKVLNSNCISQL